MKPVKLSMTAFGPYKDKEVIDFEALNGHQLFVISGATGAGKTTIFDAICFALYGTASGSDRENTTMLRSHFAEDDVHTAVEFIFQLRDRTYRVLRQLGHIKKGNKSKTGDRYEFFEILENGEEVPRVDRQNVSEINKKIEHLIGLSEDQFKQIVMLPQGEFRKLLTSETENKEDILRRIFKTERYREMNDVLKEKKARLQEQFESKRQMLDYHIQSITALLEKRENSPLFTVLEQEHYNTDQILAGLAEETTFLQIEIKTNEEKHAEQVNKFEKQQKYYYEAKATNEKFTELDEKRAEQEKLQNEKIVFLQKEKKVQAAERAQTIEPYEKQVIDRRVELTNKKQAVAQANANLERAKRLLAETEIKYREEEKNGEKREKLKRDLERYAEFLPIVKELHDKKEKMVQLEKEMNANNSQLSKLEELIKSNSDKIESNQKDIVEKEKVLLTRGEKEKLRYELREQYKIFEKYNELKREEYAKEKILIEKQKEYKRREKSYKEYEAIWLENQAVILASQLQSGDPCPVCGSTHHPHKKEVADGVFQEEFDKRREMLETAENAYREVFNEFKFIENQLKTQAQEVSKYGVALEHVSTETEKVIERGKQVAREIDELDKITKQVEQMRETVVKLEQHVKQAREQKDDITKQLQACQTEYASLRAVVQEQTSRIPEEIQALEMLQEKIKATKVESTNLEKRWVEIQKKYEVAKDEVTKAQVHMMNGESQVEEVTVILNNLEEVYKEKIKEANFESEQQYVEAKLSLEARAELEKEIEQYKQQVVNVKKRIEELTAELSEKEREDLAKLEEALQQLKTERDQAFERLNSSRKLYEAAVTLQKNITEVQKSTEQMERNLSVVNDLYDVIRGQNAKKISFERYLQIDYLEQITYAANERFRKLTNGQFQLIRSDRQEAYGKQSGLAIDVYDAYTGQTRDVKTLSGGEKFIASLCLALGMSDVIQSFQGSISIDTMFIDEGFGSLDDESLHKSIDALVNLQQTGRMIGVISHVDELKTMFPAMLEVKKTKEGHSQTKFVLK